jgi:hypothetical protein
MAGYAAGAYAVGPFLPEAAMAMTTCKECQAQISDRAESCPKCGAPQRGTVTTQLTAKRYKGAQLGAMLLMCVGVVGIVGEGYLWGSAAMAVGLMAYLVVRARAWWAHG